MRYTIDCFTVSKDTLWSMDGDQVLYTPGYIFRLTKGQILYRLVFSNIPFRDSITRRDSVTGRIDDCFLKLDRGDGVEKTVLMSNMLRDFLRRARLPKRFYVALL